MLKGLSRITSMSVKESLDTLPTGLCYYWPDGLVKLVNVRMNEICRAATGEALSDASAFWDALMGGTLPCAVQGGEKPIVTLPDGSAVSFRRNELTFEGRLLYELTAADVTEEYRLHLELTEKREAARYLNARLKALSGSIAVMVMDKEALQTKTQIHDELGHGLLMAKRYLTDTGAVEKSELLRQWRLNLLLLNHDGKEAWQKPYYVSRKRAADLGVELRIDGVLPEAEHLQNVIDTALNVHVTNVLRHAHGKQAFLSVSEGADDFTLTFTNDGKPPAAPVRETGGLANLRREAEAAGGHMTIQSALHFELILTLPKEAADHGL